MLGTIALRTLRQSSLSYRNAVNIGKRTHMLQAGKDFINGIRGKPTTFSCTSSLFTVSKLQAYHPDWYSRGLVVKNFDTRSYLLLLHMWMIHHKLLKCGDFADLVDEALYAMHWEDLENWIRGAPGVEEMYVQKFLRQMTKAGLMFSIELDDALKYEPDEQEVLLRIGDVLWRHLYNEATDKDEQIEILAKYARDEFYSVQSLPDQAVVEGRFKFGALPPFSGEHLSEEESDKIIRGLEYGHWYEDRSHIGKPYFWNNESLKKRWDLPKPEEEEKLFETEIVENEDGTKSVFRTRVKSLSNAKEGSHKTIA